MKESCLADYSLKIRSMCPALFLYFPRKLRLKVVDSLKNFHFSKRSSYEQEELEP